MTGAEFWLRTLAGAIFGSIAGYAAHSGWLEFANIPGNSMGWAVAIGLIAAAVAFVGVEILDFVLDLVS